MANVYEIAGGVIMGGVVLGILATGVFLIARDEPWDRYQARRIGRALLGLGIASALYLTLIRHLLHSS